MVPKLWIIPYKTDYKVEKAAVKSAKIDFHRIGIKVSKSNLQINILNVKVFCRFNFIKI
jgi:hypothetical protein